MISLRKLIRVSTGEAFAKAKASPTPTNQWSLEEAALQLKTTIDCVEELLAGKIDRFQIEPLITMLTHAGMKVRVEIVIA
ncbi:XRE family transcriptional regulator [Chamaesiphon sp. VAR_48_metabat_403]|uniref:XRE family transcriptional regulator n=1 Tax=Chamaesiphon sp. VAR_48_metabat_403 TaxID=2964700 RepID=UPI00286DFB6A|nr:XRE family transcriptional regulator [Chamaesiphon sp. VAR_48_metabat_403]